MGMKEKMASAVMDRFFSEMSGEDKKQLMAAMMERFVGGMSAEERQDMMKTMMPMMMGEGHPMMAMMSKMMSGCCEAGEAPWDMCKKMMSSIGKSSELASFATPEVRGLFEEWAGQIETEILSFLSESGSADPQRIAERFKLSLSSVHYFLNRLAQKGKIDLKAEKKT